MAYWHWDNNGGSKENSVRIMCDGQVVAWIDRNLPRPYEVAQEIVDRMNLQMVTTDIPVVYELNKHDLNGAFDGKYGVITAQNKVFPPGEPLFLLRGQDMLAPSVVRHYAVEYMRAHADVITPDVKEAFALIMEQVARMEAWPVKKLPD